MSEYYDEILEKYKQKKEIKKLKRKYAIYKMKLIIYMD